MIKNISILLLLLFASTALSAQQTDIYDFEVNGIKVIHKPSKKKVISTKVFFKWGTRMYDKETEGIEALALSWVTSSGTKSYPKDEFNAILERTGSGLSGSTTYDYGKISLSCLTQSWNEGWSLLSDVICHPSYDENEFNNIKQQMIAGAQQGESDPDTYLRNTAMVNTFGNGPYANIPEGSAAALDSLSMQEVKDYYDGMKNTARMFIVVVGDVSKEDLRAKVAELDCVPNVAVRMTPFPDTKIEENSFNSTDREIATNYLRGVMNAPQIGDADEAAMRVAMSILGDHMWTEIRTKRNLSYAPAAFFPSVIAQDPYTVLYVSTDKPTEAAQVMMDEIRKIRKEGFTEEELVNKKGKFLTQYYMGQETTSSQSETIGRSELTIGWQEGLNMMNKVNGLSLEQINAAFNKYLTAVNWTYLGDPSVIDKTVFTAPILEKVATEQRTRGPVSVPSKKQMKELRKSQAKKGKAEDYKKSNKANELKKKEE